MVVQIAQELLLYLQAAGAGVIDEDLFAGALPDESGEAASLHEPGGETQVSDVPELSRRNVWLTVRSTSRLGAYERIWNLLQLLTGPESGVIDVEGDLYTVQVIRLPADEASDEAGRYLMSCLVSAGKVAAVSDAWLETLAQFTESTLGEEWRVYRGFQGSCRPSVSWQCSGRELTAAIGMVSRLVKKFTARLCAADPDNYQQAVDSLLIAMANQIKFVLPDDGMFLSISGIVESRNPADQTTGDITLSLTGQVPRLIPDVPVMAGLQVQSNLNS